MSTATEERRVMTNSRGEHLDNVDIHLEVEDGRMTARFHAILTDDKDSWQEKTGRLVWAVGLFADLDMPDMKWERSLKNLEDAIEEHGMSEEHHHEIRNHAKIALEQMIPTPQRDVNFAVDIMQMMLSELLQEVRSDVSECMVEMRIDNPADYIEELACGGLIDEIVAKSPAGGEVEAHSARKAMHKTLDHLKVMLTRSELAELQGLAEHIDEGGVQLR